MDKIEKDMIHNIEELAELQKELTKFLRGKLRREKLIEEIADVEIALKNIKKYFDIKELEMIKIWGKKKNKIHEELK
jgi:hypothetical protein